MTFSKYLHLESESNLDSVWIEFCTVIRRLTFAVNLKKCCVITLNRDVREIFGSNDAGWVDNSQCYRELNIFAVILVNAFGANIINES